MKLNGTHKFKVSSQQVFNAILDPDILKRCIPGCSSIEYLGANQLRASITMPLPGLRGPYGAIIHIAQAQAPSKLMLEVQRKGRAGSVNATSQIDIRDEADGALLSYNASADLEGPIALANNPLGEKMTKNTLSTFFTNLDKAIV